MASIASINNTSGSSAVIQGTKGWLFSSSSKIDAWASTWAVKYLDGPSKTFNVTLVNLKKNVSSKEKSTSDLETITCIQVDDPSEKKERNYNLSNNKNTIYSISLKRFSDLGVYLNIGFTAEKTAEKIDTLCKDEVSKYLDNYFKKSSILSYFSLSNYFNKKDEKKTFSLGLKGADFELLDSKLEVPKESSSSSSSNQVSPMKNKDEIPALKVELPPLKQKTDTITTTTTSSSSSSSSMMTTVPTTATSSKTKSTTLLTSTKPSESSSTQSKPSRQPCPSYVGPAIVAASVASFITYYLSNYMGQMFCSFCNKN